MSTGARRAALLAAAFWVASCGAATAAGPPAAADPVLATVGAERITRAYLEAARALGMSGGADEGGLVRHLAELKLLALLGHERHADQAAAIEGVLAEQRRATLANRYEREVLLAQVAAVTEADVEAVFVPYHLHDVDRYFFEVAEEARDFLEKRTADPVSNPPGSTKVSFTGILPRELAPELRALAPTLKEKEWYGPYPSGERAYLYQVVKLHRPPEEMLRRDREAIRERLEKERIQQAGSATFETLRRKFALEEHAAPMDQVLRGTGLGDLERSTPFASWKGGGITAGDLLDAVLRQTARSGHPIYTTNRLKVLYTQMLRESLLALEARELRYEEDPAFQAMSAFLADQAGSAAAAAAIQRSAAVSPAEAEAYWKAHRKEFPGTLEESRPAVGRMALREKTARLAAEFRAEAERKYPVVVPAKHEP